MASKNIWVVFSFIFLVLSGFHFYWAFQMMPDFVPPERPFAGSVSVQIAGMDVDGPLKAFAANFNQYVHSQNNSSKNQNLLSGFGYVIAFFTALASFIDIRRREKNEAVKSGHNQTDADIGEAHQEPIAKDLAQQEDPKQTDQPSASNADKGKLDVGKW